MDYIEKCNKVKQDREEKRSENLSKDGGKRIKLPAPCFHYEIPKINKKILEYKKDAKFILNYSTKSFIDRHFISEIDKHLDGFTVSSKEDLINVRNESYKPILLVTPSIGQSEIETVNKLDGSITFNSLNQMYIYENKLSDKVDFNIRVDPRFSNIKDERYNPCREISALGVNIEELKDYFSKITNKYKLGLHFHNSHTEDEPLILECTLKKIGFDFIKNFKRLNIGGGYIYSKELVDMINYYQDKLSIPITVEPSSYFVNDAGSLICEITDRFEKNDENFLIINGGVNYLPECFEYQFHPKVKGFDKQYYGFKDRRDISDYFHIFGNTCLAGDYLGEHILHEETGLGNFDTLIFENVGAYSYVKSHTFNGIPKASVVLSDKTVEEYVISFGKVLL